MENDQDETGKPKGSGVEGGPMAMGMAMAKNMMAQMGQGGSPMEMMEKMMAQMSQGDDKPPMEKMMGMCMGMCSGMLNAIRQTNALAVFAPELEQTYSDWLKEGQGRGAAGRQR